MCSAHEVWLRHIWHNGKSFRYHNMRDAHTSYPLLRVLHIAAGRDFMRSLQPSVQKREHLLLGDQYNDGDPFDDPAYIAHFQLILQALREKRKLRITFTGARGKRNTWVFVPYKLEYSVKDDKFRLLTAQTYYGTVNLGRIEACELLDHYSPKAFHLPQVKMDTLVMELTDERNALERAMVHFSHFEKETERLEENRYRVTLRYSREDETELVIRLLSFGPVLKVLSPQNMVDELRKRILRQRYLSSKAGRAEMEE